MTRSKAEPSAAKITAEFDAWFTAWRFLLLLSLLIVVAFSETLIHGGAFFYRDTSLFNYPLAWYNRDSFRLGELPLWNPLNNCGIPFLAQWNAMTLYPLTLVYHLLPMPYGLTAFSFLHVLLAGAGMYLLARRWTDSRFAASLAGLVFAWNGIVLHAMMWPNSLATFAWMPWTVLLTERALKEGGRHILLAALVGTLQMLTGVPEIIMTTWLFAGGIFLLELWRQRSAWWRVAGRFAACVGLVSGLAAAQLLPFLDLLAHSQRSPGYGKDVWALPLWGWANFLSPLFRTTPAVIGVYSQDEQQWTASYYFGIATVALGLFGFLRPRQPRFWLLSILALLGAWLAFGRAGHLFTVVQAVLPVLGFFRYPVKMLLLVMFALPLLAAWGAVLLQKQALAEAPEPEPSGPTLGARPAPAPPAAGSSLRRQLLLVGGAFLLVLAALVVVQKQFAFPDDEWRAVLKNSIVRAGFLAATLLALDQMLRTRLLFWKQWTGAAVLVLIGADVLWHTPLLAPTIPGSHYGWVQLKMKNLPRAGESRAMISDEMNEIMRFGDTPIRAEYFLVQRWSLYRNSNLYDGIPSVTGLYSLYVKEQAEAEKALYKTRPFPEKFADFLGAAQLCPGRLDFAWETRTNFLPLATAGQKPIFVEGTNALPAMTAGAFDPRREVYLPKEAEPLVKVREPSEAKVTLRTFSAHRLEFDLEAAAPCLMVVAQTYYHPWQATVDGQPVPLWRANHAYQALEAPAGRHTVVLQYRDRAFRLGAGITVASLALWGAGFFLTRPRPKRPQVVAGL